MDIYAEIIITYLDLTLAWAIFQRFNICTKTLASNQRLAVLENMTRYT